jgi:hypothetical protein
MIASVARAAGLLMPIGFGPASLIGQAPQPQFQFQPRQPDFDRMLDPFHAELHPSTT